MFCLFTPLFSITFQLYLWDLADICNFYPPCLLGLMFAWPISHLSSYFFLQLCPFTWFVNFALKSLWVAGQAGILIRALNPYCPLSSFIIEDFIWEWIKELRSDQYWDKFLILWSSTILCLKKKGSSHFQHQTWGSFLQI